MLVLKYFLEIKEIKMNSYEKHQPDSAYAYKNVVIPKMKELGWFGLNNPNSKIICTEGIPDLELFDRFGCDYYIFDGNKSPMGIETKAGFKDDKDWSCFTLRSKCSKEGIKVEYNKLVESYKTASEPGMHPVIPMYKVHAYLKKSEWRLLSVAYAKTIDIIWMIDKGFCNEKENGEDHNFFYTISWNLMIKAGKHPIIWRPSKEEKYEN
ncbi:hypothetical protein A2Z67_03875 [Candidatus Woesebacteria bacterium RBG_13_36_22]|uniref:Uncharacterized protein n=1 Tax=Candidatus Woesebacteria bacterium RBG_13_36_22 TaxID=1802478 RepID=A0A1F7WZH1_9BACT|nr:MAG: hypothetical protein A2Z67_03875 [Candidatus Woesebacteria bacterium RBG_13_36_22]